MMVNCPVCGKLTAIHWPQHWIYRRGDAYYCSWNCLDTDITKDLKLLHEVQRKRRERKMYNKLEKDGMPAKKSGPKPKKVEVPEPVSGGPWEKMETPETITIPAEKINMPEPPCHEPGLIYRVSAIQTQIGRWEYSEKYGWISFQTKDGKDETTMTPEEWAQLLRDLPDVFRVLEVKRR